VLGQAMRALVLVTTNEPMRTLHPALSRPGRCLRQVSFERFDRSGIEGWLDARGIEAPDQSTASLAELYAHASGLAPTRPPERFGFAAPG